MSYMHLPFEKSGGGVIPFDDDTMEAQGLYVTSVSVPVSDGTWRPGIMFRFLDSEGDALRPPVLLFTDEEAMHRVGTLLWQAAEAAVETNRHEEGLDPS